MTWRSSGGIWFCLSPGIVRRLWCTAQSPGEETFKQPRGAWTLILGVMGIILSTRGMRTFSYVHLLFFCSEFYSVRIIVRGINIFTL